MLKKEGLESSSDNLNPSWRDILLNLLEDEEENDIINIWSQPIWFNYNTNRNCSVFIIEIIVIMVYYLLMIVSLKIKSFLSHQTFQNKYLIGTNFHEIYAIVGGVPNGWKQIFQSMGECMIFKMTFLTE